MSREDQPTHAGHLSIETIAGEKLHARLARPDLEHPSGPWLLDASGEREPPAATVENEVVVIPIGDGPQFFDPFADAMWSREVERRSGHVGESSGRHRRCVRW